MPLVLAGPGVTKGQECKSPVELLDLYPTLIDLCGLDVRQDLEGVCLTPQLVNAQTPRDRPAITTHNQGNHAVRSLDFRYIRYADGSEELYDHRQDPHEHTNLASDPRWRDVLQEHRRWLPKIDVAPVDGSAHRVLTYVPAKNEAIWEGSVILPTDPIPE